MESTYHKDYVIANLLTGCCWCWTHDDDFRSTARAAPAHWLENTKSSKGTISLNKHLIIWEKSPLTVKLMIDHVDVVAKIVLHSLENREESPNKKH